MESNQDILRKLERIEKDVVSIKEHMVDIDSIMTEEDYESLLAYRKEKASGKLISHKSIKKDLDL